MPIRVRCPGCQDAFETSSKNVGRRIRCPMCGSKIRVSNQPKKRKKKRELALGADGDDLSDSIDSGSAGSGSFIAASLSDDTIAAVLADGDEMPREYVPNADGGSHVLTNGVLDNEPSPDDSLVHGSLSEITPDADRGSLASSAKRKAVKKAGESLASESNDFRTKAPPFVVGVLVGALLTFAGMNFLADASSSPRPIARPNPSSVVRTPRAQAPPATPQDKQASHAKQESQKKSNKSTKRTKPTKPAKTKPAKKEEPPGESNDVVSQIVVTKSQLETKKSLLSSKREIALNFRNDSNSVVRTAQLQLILQPAAFGDVDLAKENLTVTFAPELGLGEEQELRLTPTSGGAIATANFNGPVRLVAKVLDADWQGKEATAKK